MSTMIARIIVAITAAVIVLTFCDDDGYCYEGNSRGAPKPSANALGCYHYYCSCYCIFINSTT